jgi:membrane associated rhomboid family serine protease
MAENHHHMSLGVVSFGLALGVTSGGLQLAAALSSLYIGYGPTFVGAIAGAVWAFVDGLIAGVLIAWFYNRLLLRRRKTLD